ncbi:cupin domain-containing protein [Leeia oryzae]|uniref:cupin domain-containing protein n=1 Tax=Leeia oryzae TaxID=356662 RepID=UPI00036DEC3A|nr:cupin domain-containing protein [Leeia oryzae]
MNITRFTDTARFSLTDSAPVAVPLGTPVSVTSVHAVERQDGVETGIWECTPGRWVRQIKEQEFCHFISGRCTFTPDGGEPIQIQGGDALLLPANSTGVWDIQETVRKSYVLIYR